MIVILAATTLRKVFLIVGVSDTGWLSTFNRRIWAASKPRSGFWAGTARASAFAEQHAMSITKVDLVISAVLVSKVLQVIAKQVAFIDVAVEVMCVIL